MAAEQAAGPWPDRPGRHEVEATEAAEARMRRADPARPPRHFTLTDRVQRLELEITELEQRLGIE